MDVVKNMRGSIWWLKDEFDKYKGERGILRGSRPVVIINNPANEYNDCTITYLPISKCESHAGDDSKIQMFYQVPIQIPGNKSSYICCNSITTTTTAHLGEYIGQISESKLKEVENELMRYLSLSFSEKIVTREVVKEVKDLEKTSKTTAFSITDAVACPELKKVYSNCTEMAKELDCSPASISKASRWGSKLMHKYTVFKVATATGNYIDKTKEENK
jgi:mRNA-degrading endonuclease toxin of MazEF toxin-antitoxin module